MRITPETLAAEGWEQPSAILKNWWRKLPFSFDTNDSEATRATPNGTVTLGYPKTMEALRALTE